MNRTSVYGDLMILFIGLGTLWAYNTASIRFEGAVVLLLATIMLAVINVPYRLGGDDDAP